MALLATGRHDSDFSSAEVPQKFVAEVLDATLEAGRVTESPPPKHTD